MSLLPQRDDKQWTSCFPVIQEETLSSMYIDVYAARGRNNQGNILGKQRNRNVILNILIRSNQLWSNWTNPTYLVGLAETDLVTTNLS